MNTANTCVNEVVQVNAIDIFENTSNKIFITGTGMSESPLTFWSGEVKESTSKYQTESSVCCI